MEKLFVKYPKIFYGGTECLDLTRRVKIAEEHKDSLSLFNPLEIKAGLRADHIADAYYEDADMDWMIYLANEMVDPYFDWYLDDLDFDKYIVDKYGSIEYAIEKKKFYRNNWATTDEQIPFQFYDNNLAWIEKQYWTPVYGQGAKIIAYKRKEDNWVMNTNRIIKYTYSQTDALFTPGEIIDLWWGGEVLGGGECITSNSTALVIQHVTGDTNANTTVTKQIRGETSGAVTNTNFSLILKENISLTESKYWTPVSYFDWEVETNEAKKILNVIDAGVAIDMAEELRLKLRE